MSLTFTPSQMYLRDLDRQLAAGRVYLAQLDALIVEAGERPDAEHELDEPMHDFCRRCGVQIEVGKQGGQPELCADCAPIVYRERARERAERYRERNRHGKR